MRQNMMAIDQAEASWVLAAALFHPLVKPLRLAMKVKADSLQGAARWIKRLRRVFSLEKNNI
ncbi:MAG: hypothetical protein EBV79_06570 [Betaproteobacteria bacterium]|nr:hypothetical protein [Betaproteobacteria bacterium]